MRQTGEKAARVEVRVFGEIFTVHRGESRNSRSLQTASDFPFVAFHGPGGNELIQLALVGLAVFRCTETIICRKLRLAHCLTQCLPLCLRVTSNRYPLIFSLTTKTI